MVAIQPETYAAEAVYPGTSLGIVEDEKIRKHTGYLRAYCPADKLVPFTTDEQGAMGEAAQYFLDRVFLTSECPVASKTYWLRILAAETARCLYTMLHEPLVAGISTQRRIPSYDTEGGTPVRTTPHPDHESDPAADMATPPVPRAAPAPAPSPALAKDKDGKTALDLAKRSPKSYQFERNKAECVVLLEAAMNKA